MKLTTFKQKVKKARANENICAVDLLMNWNGKGSIKATNHLDEYTPDDVIHVLRSCKVPFRVCADENMKTVICITCNITI